jgi:hypothetical protein
VVKKNKVFTMNKKRKTGIFALIIGIAFVFAFIACDNSNGSGGGNSDGGGGGTPAHTHQWGKWEQTKTPTMTEAGEDQRVCALDSSHKEKRAVFININVLDAWLADQPDNTDANPYIVKLLVNTLGGNSTTQGTVGNVLIKNKKYVSLDLSESNITIIGRAFDFYYDMPSTLVEIILPNSLIHIGDGAFTACNNLTGIIIPNTVTNIGGGAFQYCRNLKSITIPGSVTYLGDGAFYSCSSLVSAIIGNGVTEIGDGAFENCESLTSVTMGNNVETIGDNAFWNTGLISVTISNKVTKIGQDAFVGCGKLTAITVAANNPNYSSDNGIVYNKNKTSLIMYPAGKTASSFTIPNSVTSIVDGAFQYNRNLKSITIPDGVKSIGESAFSGCTGFTSVTIPASVTSIGFDAFGGCTNLTSVTFATGSNITSANFGMFAFPGDNNGIRTPYSTGKAGTYTRAAGGTVWTKQP